MTRPAWLSGYDAEASRRDLTAGLTVGVVVVPQAMAYAVIAGVPPVYGLYASVVPLLVYPLLGTSRQLAVGVNALSMIVVASVLTGLAEPGTAEYIGLAITLALLVGLVELAMGVARLGFLADLLSQPVILGFTTAAALIIMLSQAGAVLGIDLPRFDTAIGMVRGLQSRVGDLHPASLALASGAVALLALLARWRPSVPGELVLLVLGTALASALDWAASGIAVVGNVPGGLPRPTVPGLAAEQLPTLLPGVAALVLVHFMGVISIGRAFAARHRYSISPSRELLAIGAANVAGSLFRAIPGSGSFSRSAIADRAGARSPLANVSAALVVVSALLFLTPAFQSIPVPALGAIILMAAASLIDVRALRALFTAKRSDGAVALFTLLATLAAGIEIGLLAGVGLATLMVLYRLSRPNVAELGHLPGTQQFRDRNNFSEARRIEGILILRVDAGLVFFNAQHIRDLVLVEAESGRPLAVILDGAGTNFIDTTAAEALREVAETLEGWGTPLHVTGLPRPARAVLEDVDLGEALTPQRFHLTVDAAVRQILSADGDPELSERRRAYVEACTPLDGEPDPTREAELL